MKKPLIVKVMQAAPAAISWLHSTKEARTLAVFNRSCTLTRDDGELLSLVTSDIGPGPYAMVIESDQVPFSSEYQLFSGIEVGRPAVIRNGCLSLEWLTVDPTEAELWNPQPDWLALTADMFLTKLPELKIYLEVYGSPDSLGTLISGVGQNQIQQQIEEAWILLAEGLSDLDISNCQDQLSQIVGLGGGLTPAGDDFLMGIIIALWSFVPIPQAEQIALDVVRAAKGRTTRLSVAFLEAAARGEVAEPWHKFVTALAIDNPVELRRAGLRILGIGQTSGTDSLTGFLLAGDILAKALSTKR